MLFLLVLLVVIDPRRRVEAVGTEALQQRSHSFGFWQLGDLEVLLIVRRVLSDQTLLLHRKGRPLVFLVTPLAVFPVFLFIIVVTLNDGLFCKVHSWLKKGGVEIKLVEKKSNWGVPSI